jgi:hypothetical protein
MKQGGFGRLRGAAAAMSFRCTPGPLTDMAVVGSSSCYICVLIFIIFYMLVVFGDMMSKKTDLRMRAC